MTDSNKIAVTKAYRPKGKPRGRPIQKGQVLNPKGRPPRGQSIAEKLRELSDPTLIAQTIIDLATIDKDPRALTILLERTEGKVTDVIMNINATFQESDLLLDRVVAWLTKDHPDLVDEFAKVCGVSRD